MTDAMTDASVLPESGSARNERDEPVWDQLLALLAARKVIPIIGSDVVQVDGGAGVRPLTECVARRVADRLEIPLGEIERPTLNLIACRYLASGGDINDVYAYVNRALNAAPAFAIPDTLTKLARIDAFDLYVTTTFDDLLLRALNQERNAHAAEYTYSPKRPGDIPDGMNDCAVYYLFGKASAMPEYAVTEEDTLEFVHALQSDSRSPNQLLARLGTQSLLIIGSGYSDWLARFFLRIAKHKRLLEANDKTDYFADEPARANPLRQFLTNFSKKTKVFSTGGVEFVDELSLRWAEYRSTHPIGTGPVAQPQTEPRPVFISYASEDSVRAQELAAALRVLGVPVWIDKSGRGDVRSGLEGGDDWDHKIRTEIQRASLFVPIMSRHVATDEPRYVIREWKTAVHASENMPFGRTYIVPVRVDDLPESSPRVPDAFRATQWADARTAGPELIARRLQELYRTYQRAQASV